MDSCCQTSSGNSTKPTLCPVCNQKGKAVPLITLKSLLQPQALELIHPEWNYAFCNTPSCDIVYYSNEQTFDKHMLKVAVFQKDEVLESPLCYCFGWTRERLMHTVKEQGKQTPIQHIREQVQANRCGCEVNNPQGSCCLGNVTTFIRSLDKI